MKKLTTLALAAALTLTTFSSRAQYYDMMNQVANMVQNAAIGGFNYKGFVEAEYVQGVGNTGANFLNFTTTQGFSYSSWFYMGAGAGVDVVFSNIDTPYAGDHNGVQTTKTGVMIPLFTDFRFIIGSGNTVGVNLGVKMGATFLMGSNYLELNNGYLNNREYFYFRPYVGVRVPLNNQKPKQAVNFGLSYQLITSNNYCYWGGGSPGSVTLNGLGVNISYEW